MVYQCSEIEIKILLWWLFFGMQKSFDKQICINYMCIYKPSHSQKQERSKKDLFPWANKHWGKKKHWWGKKKLFSVNMFECAVINRVQFKGSGNLKRFLSRLTNFLQHAVSARKRHLLHIRAAGCFKKKKKACVCEKRTPPSLI